MMAALPALNDTLRTGPIAAVSKQSGGDASDRFLKLLVAQMRNQDPLNPLDNAQVTSQMAQISTVTGIDKLNTTVEGLNAQFAQSQMLQVAAMVGRDVVVKGDTLAVAAGVGQGGFELAGPADKVSIDILGPAGQVQGHLELGAQGSGRHGFDWTAPAGAADAGLRFRVSASAGTAAVAATPLMRDHIDAVSTAEGQLRLELSRSGSVAYADILAFN